MAWREVLRDFWRDFIGAVDEIKDLKISQVIDALDALLAPHLFPPRADGGDPRQCPTCGSGRLTLKLSKFGAFIGCSNYPECRYTRPLSVPADGSGEIGTKKLGEDPKTGLEVTLRSGRFGPYVQLGEAVDGEKPKRASLPKGTAPDDVDLDRALALLSLPREIGRHPEDGEPIRAGIGRFGPYVQHGKTYANLEAGDDIFHIGLNRAVTLIAEKLAKGPRFRRFGADPGRALGAHPTTRRADRGEERPLRSLCQSRRRQRHAAARQDAGDHHARGGRGAARCPGGTRRDRAARAAAQGQARRARHGATGQKAGQRRPRRHLPNGPQPANPHARPRKLPNNPPGLCYDLGHGNGQ